MNPLDYKPELFRAPDVLERRIIIPGVEQDILKDASNGNPKGPVYQWTFADGRMRQLNTFVRKKGTLFGDHYHTGKDPAKNPELFQVA